MYPFCCIAPLYIHVMTEGNSKVKLSLQVFVILLTLKAKQNNKRKNKIVKGLIINIRTLLMLFLSALVKTSVYVAAILSEVRYVNLRRIICSRNLNKSSMLHKYFYIGRNSRNPKR